MINSVSTSYQNTEVKTATIVPFESPQGAENKKNDPKPEEKLQADKVQLKNEKKELEEQRREQNEKLSQKMLDELSKDIEILHSVGLSFAQHDDTGRTMVSVMDRNTDELIRQIPAEDFLDMAAKMEEMIGILFDRKV